MHRWPDLGLHWSVRASQQSRAPMGTYKAAPVLMPSSLGLCFNLPSRALHSASAFSSVLSSRGEDLRANYLRLQAISTPPISRHIVLRYIKASHPSTELFVATSLPSTRNDQHRPTRGLSTILRASQSSTKRFPNNGPIKRRNPASSISGDKQSRASK